MSGGATKVIKKRSGLIGGATGVNDGTVPFAPVSGRDMSAAAARLPTFVPSTPSVSGQSLLTRVVEGRSVVRVRLEGLRDSPYQPRLKYPAGRLLELAESLKHVQADPLLLRMLPDSTLEIISGHRRVRAGRLGQLDELDAIVVQVSDSDARLLVLAANEAREDFTDYERALAYRAALDTASDNQGAVLSQRQLAAQIGVDQSLVVRRLSMLKLPDDVQGFLRERPDAFSCRYASKLIDLTSRPYDSEKLLETLGRVADGSLEMSALFSVMESSASRRRSGIHAPELGARSILRGGKIFAEVAGDTKSRRILVKLPGDCVVADVVELVVDALASRYPDKS